MESGSDICEKEDDLEDRTYMIWYEDYHELGVFTSMIKIVWVSYKVENRFG